MKRLIIVIICMQLLNISCSKKNTSDLPSGLYLSKYKNVLDILILSNEKKYFHYTLLNDKSYYQDGDWSIVNLAGEKIIQFENFIFSYKHISPNVYEKSKQKKRAHVWPAHIEKNTAEKTILIIDPDLYIQYIKVN